MYEQHTDGRLIAELSDQELLITINQISDRIAQAVATIQGIDSLSGTVSIIGILNSDYDPKILLKQAKATLQMLDESFSAYVMEAVLRNLDVSSPVQFAYKRSSRLHTQFLLS